MAFVLGLGFILLPHISNAEGNQISTESEASAIVAMTSAEAVARLGVLKGDGEGVTDAYLGKRTTRLQSALLMLRLIGKEQEASSYAGAETFADANQAGKASQPVLAYLKAHPEYGWSGTGTGSFDPLSTVTAQQFYKVMLEALGYRSGTDFAYKDTLSFASTLGLSRAANVSSFTNRELAAALTETLQAKMKGAESTLLNVLIERKAIAGEHAKLLDGQRIDISRTAEGATYLTDGKGMALYLFTKDMADRSACQDACLKNWPVFYSDQLLLADGLDVKDFGSFTRTEGTKQLTYKGWPLYYFVKDAKSGDVSGEGVGEVWFLIKQPFYSIGLGTDTKLGNYLVDSAGVSLYYFDKDPAGSSVCSGECLDKWPAFYAESIVVPKGLQAEDFGQITRADGKKQTTFKGYPLYYYFQDAKRGDLKGQSLGEAWFVVNPAKFAGTTAGKATPTQTPVGEKVTIEMKEYSFTPTELTVKAGTTIEFINRDDMKHNAVAVDGSFKTELLEKGQSATIKLDKPGVYEYFCEPHKSFMKGKIIVE